MKKHLPFIIFFCAFFIVGLAIYRDYGVPWDEIEQIKIGEMNTRYIVKGDPELLSFYNRYYGPVFEMPIWYLTRNMPNSEKIFARHLVTFLVFALGVLGLYLLAYRLFRNPWWALLTANFLVFTPRIFADSFYNSKDIPFLAFFSISVLLSVYLLDAVWAGSPWQIQFGAAALAAFATAIAVDARVPGVVIIPLVCVLLIFTAICNPKRWKVVGGALTTYLVIAILFIILFWPILWRDPVQEFINGLGSMSRFTWEGRVLYRGQWILATDLPWDYIPTWILISTPLLPLGGFVLGVVSLVLVALNDIRSNVSRSFGSFLNGLTSDSLAWLVITGWLVLPLIAVIFFQSVLYDGWRHMFFIFPSILLIAVFGMKTVWERISSLSGYSSLAKSLAGLVLVAGLVEPLIFILQYHPHENMYFNAVAGDPEIIRQNFDKDYWGLSYKQGIDHLLAEEPPRKVVLAVNDFPGKAYINNMLTPDQASRLDIGPLEDADYFITTFRDHPEDYLVGKEYYSISIRGIKIMAIYKLK